MKKKKIKYNFSRRIRSDGIRATGCLCVCWWTCAKDCNGWRFALASQKPVMHRIGMPFPLMALSLLQNRIIFYVTFLFFSSHRCYPRPVPKKWLRSKVFCAHFFFCCVVKFSCKILGIKFSKILIQENAVNKIIFGTVFYIIQTYQRNLLAPLRHSGNAYGPINGKKNFGTKNLRTKCVMPSAAASHLNGTGIYSIFTNSEFRVAINYKSEKKKQQEEKYTRRIDILTGEL